MAISTLTNIITGEFISNISKSGESGSDAPKVGMSKEPEEPLTVTLQRGARGAVAALQALNGGISYINLARDYTDKLLNVVDALDALVNKASKGNISPSNAKAYRETFDKLSKAYDQLIKGSVVKGRDILSVSDMSSVLKQGGLDPENVDELEAAFNKISSFSGVEVSADGETRAKSRLFPAENFYRALRQATRDPEDPPQNDDGSGAFATIRVAVKELKAKVERNVEALESAAELVGRNLELVRATGFAFLDASQKATGNEEPEEIAFRVRSTIRSSAGKFLSEAHNLEAVMSAGLLRLAAESEEEKT